MSGLLSKVFRRNVVARKLPVNIQKRQMSGNLVTNVRVEENSGLREISYWTWEFSATSVARIIGYFIIPSTVFYQMATMELVRNF